MRYITYLENGAERPGVLSRHSGTFHPLRGAGLDYPSLLAFIQGHTQNEVWALEQLARQPGAPLDSVTLLAPIPRPHHDVICVGLNYRDHVAESAAMHIPGATVPSGAASYFSKRVNLAAGPDAEIAAPFKLDTRVDYEAEVCVVIGQTARQVDRADAWRHVFGLCCFNDLTGRDLQDRHGQWFYGKSMDGLTALGPWIVSMDELTLPLALNVSSRINGQLRQHGNTANMIHPIDAIIEELSRGITLDAGSLIATGTPSGVGAGFSPPRCLAPGDLCEIAADGLGVLRNTFRHA